MKYFGTLILLFVSVFAGLIINGVVISILWGWFIVPLGVMEITLVHALGLVLVINMFKGKSSSSSKDTKGKSIDELFVRLWEEIVIGPAFTLFFGWVIHSLM